MFYVYVLYSKSVDKYYTGFTTDLVQRVAEHNSLTGTRWTRGKGPWALVYYEEFGVEQEARVREIKLKRKKRRSYLTWLFAFTMALLGKTLIKLDLYP